MKDSESGGDGKHVFSAAWFGRLPCAPPLSFSHVLSWVVLCFIGLTMLTWATG